MPSIYAAHQCVFQEAGKPESVGRVALRALQFRARASDAALHARYGRWRDGSAMVGRGIGRERNRVNLQMKALLDLGFMALGIALIAFNKKIGTEIQRFNRFFWTESAFEAEPFFRVVVGLFGACLAFVMFKDFWISN
jgi:hypothetical protein